MARHIWLVIGLLWLGAAPPVQAEVVDQSASGFTRRSVHVFTAAPDQVWEALTADIDRWWNSAHTWSGEAANLFLEPEAGEEFGEKLPGGGTVTHMEVLYADKGKLLRLQGGLGPLQAMAVVAVMSIEFSAQGEGTQLTVTYVVGGYTAGGLGVLAGPVDGVITEQFERLVKFLGS